MSSNVVELNHPLVDHHLAALRGTGTSSADFRRHTSALATLLLAEATRSLPLKPVSVTTPLETIEARRLAGRIAAVPILRAGLGMVDPLIDLIPDIEIWHLGLYRDEETARPVRYYDKLPADDPTDTAFVVDPMLATGGSAALAIETLQNWGVSQIMMLSIIAAPEGIDRLTERFPNVPLYTCAIDRELNDQKFILPGLGDAGDRIFNTQR
ncbi:MAG: uracil phosphoribosyltransferase [Fuerstiella sp.]